MNQRETFDKFNIYIFKYFFTVSSIAKHLLARFLEMYYQYQIADFVVSIKTENEYI